MDKKNRFSMLEVDSKHNKNVSPEESVDAIRGKASEAQQVPQFKIVVENEEFEKNLQKHKLKSREKEIALEKQAIHSSILKIKSTAWIKIILGIYILVMVAKKYIWGTKSLRRLDGNNAELIITKSALNGNDYVLILLIMVFIYLTFFKKNPKDKK